ncbi:MAG: hypothetical protein B7733_13005 [Myxococcales bacterium FL481]|nr:MAG: hypothetical protein B7733_13005 [Myxococcales bacterium FL481]
MFGYLIALTVAAAASQSVNHDLPDYASAALCPVDQTSCGYVSGSGWGYITCPDQDSMDCVLNKWDQWDTDLRGKLGAACYLWEECDDDAACEQGVIDAWCDQLENMLDDLAELADDCDCLLTTVST